MAQHGAVLWQRRCDRTTAVVPPWCRHSCRREPRYILYPNGRRRRKATPSPSGSGARRPRPSFKRPAGSGRGAAALHTRPASASTRTLQALKCIRTGMQASAWARILPSTGSIHPVTQAVFAMPCRCAASGVAGRALPTCTLRRRTCILVAPPPSGACTTCGTSHSLERASTMAMAGRTPHAK